MCGRPSADSTLALNTIENRYDKKVSFLLAYILLIPCLANLATGAIFHWSKLGILATYTIYSFALLIDVYLFLKYFRIIGLKMLQIMFSVVMLVILNYIIFNDSRSFFSSNSKILLIIFSIYIPTAVMLVKIKKWDYFIGYMQKISSLGIFITLVGVLFFRFAQQVNYMAFSTMLLPHVMFMYYNWNRDKKLSQIIIFLLGVAMMLGYGGRMSFFSALAFILILTFIQWKHTSIKSKMFIIFTVITILILLLFFMDGILDVLISLQQHFGWNSYIIYKLKAGELIQSSSRDAIYESARYLLSKQGVGFYGLFGDRIAFEKIGISVVYVHNFFYEMWFTFGFFIGTLLIVVVMKKMIHGLLLGSQERRTVVAFFVSLIFLRLLVSSSFVVEGNFYLMLGVLFGIKSKTIIKLKGKRNI